MKPILLGSLFLLITALSLSLPAHPGRTDASGCHTCKTNCAKWGLAYGEYHCHSPKAYTAPSDEPRKKPAKKKKRRAYE